MAQQLTKLVNRFLGKLDLQIQRTNRSKAPDPTIRSVPLQAPAYHLGIKPVVTTAPLAIGRTSRWFDLLPTSLDPAIAAIRHGLSDGLSGEDLFQSILNTLKVHHKLSSNVNNTAVRLGLEDFHPIKLMNYPDWAIVFPWDSESLDEKKTRFPLSVKRNRADHGLEIQSEDPLEIMQTINDEASLISHAKQYAWLTDEIKNGFHHGGKYGYIKAEILVDGDDVRWKPGGDGNHRVAAAAALGIESIPVLITKVIRIDEARYWPNVMNQDFDQICAEHVFRQLFNAIPPKYQHPWMKWIQARQWDQAV
jgi:ParB-like chromosome segregation protein Spo0J